MSTRTEDLSPLQFLQLVGDPQRWQILVELGRSDRRVAELAERLGKAQNLVSYHLGELRTARLVSVRRSSADGRDAYYRLDPTRCGELFAATSASLHPSLRLAPVTGDATISTTGPKRRVLFLCTGNSARSQIAEALLEDRSNAAIEARSAGSHPKPLHPHAVRVMAERGIDISGRRTKHFDRYARTHFDRVITLCDKVRELCPQFPGAPVSAHWSMADPSAVAGSEEDSYRAFATTAAEIDARVELLIPQLTHQPDDERSPHGRR